MNLRNTFITLSTGIVLLASAGCTDRTSVSKQNFAEVINADYAVNGDCLFSRPLSFPFPIAQDDKLLSDTRNKLDALVTEGLLSKNTIGAGKEAVDEFAVTDAGRKTAGQGRFCYGKREVTSVDAFSAPYEFRGVQMTHVGYHYSVRNSATWAKAPAVQAAFPTVARALSPEPVDEATLVLEKEGWTLENQ